LRSGAISVLVGLHRSTKSLLGWSLSAGVRLGGL
jgi:hypothetical protein